MKLPIDQLLRYAVQKCNLEFFNISGRISYNFLKEKSYIKATKNLPNYNDYMYTCNNLAFVSVVKTFFTEK